ncbi:vWA domain-containing protein [Aliamphritea spongicola]|uniref:vWA domain-containing protein n=1 Tax=Aliamphritea spongicola TaxID=707589 RepID=UPI0023502F17|nr:VWA domain-containing protein [Aliamphritea spongicola]
MYNDKLTPTLDWKKNRGTVLVLMTIALPVLLAIVGLAVDSARAYGVKAKLSAAVDAASLAAARAISGGEASARSAANKYFDANFPPDYFSSTLSGRPSVNFSYSPSGDVAIDVSATANMPTTLVKLVGVDDIDIPSNAQTIRRVVDLSFVVDNTTSLVLGTDVSQDVIDRSKDFVGNFNESIDRIALVKYAFGAEVPVGFNNARGFSKATIENEIDAFEFGGNGNPNQFTNASEGMWRAIDALINVNNPASLRVIVFFTDGAPNTFASNFSFNGGIGNRIGAIRSSDTTSGTPRGLWEANMVADPIPSPWEFRDNNGTTLANALTGFPQYYNAHDPNASDFLVINPSHPRRQVFDYDPGNDSTNDLYVKINRVARNLPEDMAEFARQNGIIVLTLGLGTRLTIPTGPDGEHGEEMLMRMANDPRMVNNPALAADFKPGQPQGVYCHAVDKDALAPCFAEMLAVIIRLTI